MLVEVSLEHIPMQAEMCFGATTEGVTGRLLLATCPSSYSWSVIPTLTDWDYRPASLAQRRGGYPKGDTLKGEDGNDAVYSKDNVNGNDSLDGGAGTDSKVTATTEKSIVGFP